MNFLEIQADHQTIPASRGELPERVYLFDKPSIDAVNAAPAAKRPLLVRGEPGIGKSQFSKSAVPKLKHVEEEITPLARRAAKAAIVF